MSAQQANGMASLSELLVLVVDDDEDHLGLVTRLLTRQGAKVVCASSGAEALETLKQHCPDVIVSDIQMPGGDGLGLMQCVRSEREDYPRFVPSIALSSLSGDEQRRSAIQAGFWRYLTKPAVAPLLCEYVAQLGYAHKRFRASGRMLPEAFPDEVSGQQPRH